MLILITKKQLFFNKKNKMVSSPFKIDVKQKEQNTAISMCNVYRFLLVIVVKFKQTYAFVIQS